MIELTPEESQMVERGTAAEALLKDGAFNAVIHDLKAAYLDALIQTHHDQEKERNAAYYSAKALEGISASLTQWVGMKEQLLHNLKQAEEFTED